MVVSWCVSGMSLVCSLAVLVSAVASPPTNPELDVDDLVVFGSAIEGIVIDYSPPVTVSATHNGKELGKKTFDSGGSHSFTFDTTGIAVGGKILIKAFHPSAPGETSVEVTVVDA